ncbi:MAG: hypothetical protein CYG60_23520 [Actinobacteria bacterium]|jgi:ABC-type amino acid transport system permease subunit|nr:hypothetical protein [Actinomycetota bacterium]PLS82828.1 MAG: hypothetical protein CYG60_23520 [Actinomycetota bacterium]
MNDARRRTEHGEHRAPAVWEVLLHVACCGLPILILVLIGAGLTVDLLWRAAPYLAIVGAVVGIGWLAWYLRRRCWACSFCADNAKGRTGEARGNARDR